VNRDAASFRDPSGHVYHRDGRVLRTITARAAPHYEHVRDAGLLRRWTERGWLVETTEVPGRRVTGRGGSRAARTEDPTHDDMVSDNVRYVVEHTPIPFVSYPYEWPFGALKAAALLHLDLQIDALDHGVQLSDASAYNVQFDGARPVFIDLLSFRRYQPGDYWTGHRQFCEQFLNPLLLRALLGVPHNAWLRGALEGIAAGELNALLRARHKLSLNVFSHVTLMARVERRRRGAAAAFAPRDALAPRGHDARPRKPLPRASYAGMLHQLRAWIARLQPLGHGQTTWSDYETTHTYAGEERGKKQAFVARFVRATKPAMLWDFGCNTGEYAALALTEGAARVVGFEADHGALDRAFARASERQAAFLPLYMDAANPSPGQGWNQQERRGLAARAPADALLALAFTHHLAIGRNVPLDDVAAWLTALAPRGVVEFVPKADPTVQLMLSSREDVFDDYCEEAFTAALGRHARICHADTVSATGRRLFEYER
jgi:ribosomal protein L11 methylase PrmA